MKAISPIVGFILTIAMSVFVVSLSLLVIKPTIEKNRAMNLINEASSNLDLISSAINEVASEAEGSKRTISISISDGYYYLDNQKNALVYSYSSPQSIGLLGRIGNKFLSLGTIFFNFFASDILSNFTNISGSWSLNNRLEGSYGTSYFSIFGNYSNIFVSSRFSSDNNLGELFLDSAIDNLVLYLTFDEGSGNIAYDYSGNNNNGTLYNGSVVCGSPPNASNCPTWVDGKFGKALSFDGVNDYVSIPYNSVLNTSAYTISFWFNQRSASTINYEVLNNFLGIHSCKLDSNNNLWCDFPGRSIGIFIPSQNTWYNIISVNNGTHCWNYVNGQLTGGIWTCSPGSATGDSFAIDVPGNGFNGTIDEVRIYNRALSPEEIKFLYEQGLKKLQNSGMLNFDNVKNPKIVFSNPSGKIFVNELIVGNPNSKEINLLLPIYNVQFNSTFKIGKGSYQITIENIGYNSTSKKPILKITTS